MTARNVKHSAVADGLTSLKSQVLIFSIDRGNVGSNFFKKINGIFVPDLDDVEVAIFGSNKRMVPFALQLTKQTIY